QLRLQIVHGLGKRVGGLQLIPAAETLLRAHLQRVVLGVATVGPIIDWAECGVSTRRAAWKELRAVGLYHRHDRVRFNRAYEVVRARAGVADGRSNVTGQLPLEVHVVREAVGLFDSVIESPRAGCPGRERRGTREWGVGDRRGRGERWREGSDAERA